MLRSYPFTLSVEFEMAKIHPDERAAYLTFKYVFRGSDALLRCGSKINTINGSKSENEDIGRRYKNTTLTIW